MKIEKIDHLVLTVNSLIDTCRFYTNILKMKEITFGENRKALVFGDQKINLHEKGNELHPKANKPTPGSADLCFITTTPLEKVIDHFNFCGVKIEYGPVERTGALGKMKSVYIRDPDYNLLEISIYITV